MEGFYVKNDVQICPMSFLIIDQTFWPLLGVLSLYCSVVPASQMFLQGNRFENAISRKVFKRFFQKKNIFQFKIQSFLGYNF